MTAESMCVAIVVEPMIHRLPAAGSGSIVCAVRPHE
jgi:hypothetical protein